MDIKKRNLRPALSPATQLAVPSRFPDPMRSGVASALERAQTALAQDFKGISADDHGPLAGLFPVFKPGVSIEPIVTAARSFVALLTNEQRKGVHFAVDSDQWR